MFFACLLFWNLFCQNLSEAGSGLAASALTSIWIIGCFFASAAILFPESK